MWTADMNSRRGRGGWMRTRWFLPAFCFTLGGVVLAAQWAGGSLGSGLVSFGIMAIDTEDRILSFLEKPKDPPGMPDKPDKALASMGIYVFETKFLFDQLRRDAEDPNSNRDFGRVAFLVGLLAEHAEDLGEPYTRHLGGKVRELRVLRGRTRPSPSGVRPGGELT